MLHLWVLFHGFRGFADLSLAKPTSKLHSTFISLLFIVVQPLLFSQMIILKSHEPRVFFFLICQMQ